MTIQAIAIYGTWHAALESARRRGTAWMEGADPLPRFPNLAAQLELSYATDDRDHFEMLRGEAGALIPLMPWLKRRQYGFVLDMMQANMLVRSGELTRAAAMYRKAIRSVGARRGAILRGGMSNRDARNLEHLSVVLALLYNNLGEILSGDSATAGRAVREFQRAIELQPGLGYVRQRSAGHYVRQREWQNAEEAFRDVWRCAPSEAAAKILDGNLAYVQSEQAQWLRSEGKTAEAMAVLSGALSALDGKDQAGWEGRIHFLHADCLAELGRTADALEAYTTARKRYVDAKMFPSASAVAEVRSDLLVTLRQDAAAHDGYADALRDADRITTDPEHGEAADATERRKSQLRAKSGLLDLASRHHDRGRRALAQAAKEVPAAQRWNPYEWVVAQAGRTLERDDLVAYLKLHYADLLAASSDSRTRRDIVFAIRALQGKVESRLRDPGDEGTAPFESKLLNIVTPIGLEIHNATLNACGGPDRAVKELAPAMRQRIADRFGLTVPGVNMRGTDDPAKIGMYVLSIHELPRESGVLRPGKLAYIGPIAAAQSLGVPTGEEIYEGFAGEGYWVSPPFAERLAKAGHTVWEPLEFMMRHTQALVTANLADFAGHQEVRNLLETAGLIDSKRLAEMSHRESYAHIDTLTSVVRCLLSERVPIKPFTDIHRVFASGMERELPLWRIVEEIRSSDFVRPLLWGNDGASDLLQLGPRIMKQVERARSGDGKRSLAIDPDILNAILTSVREALPKGRSAGIVVPGLGMTALVRSITELEFPNLPVLSLYELMPGLGARIVGTIDLTDSAGAAPSAPAAPTAPAVSAAPATPATKGATSP